MSDLLKSFEDHSANEVINKNMPLIPDKIVTNLEEIWKGANFEDM